MQIKGFLKIGLLENLVTIPPTFVCSFTLDNTLDTSDNDSDIDDLSLSNFSVFLYFFVSYIYKGA